MTTGSLGAAWQRVNSKGGTRRPTASCWWVVHHTFTATGRSPPRRYRLKVDAAYMADLLVVVGIVVFVAAMLGLISALQRV